MSELRWFEVKLDTLRLTKSGRRGWPAGMSSAKSRMKEECLESLVAYNLDVLFPGEGLLLVNTQAQMNRTADVTAVDPLGILRVIEVKKTPVTRDDLEDQVISYAVGNASLADWQYTMADEVTFLPEQVALAIEGFRCNVRAKGIGRQAVADALPDAGWKTLDRFEQAHLKVNALRAGRGSRPAPKPLHDRRVQRVCKRLYPVWLRHLAFGDPAEMVERIVRERWGHSPTVQATEFTLIAPGVSEGEKAAAKLKAQAGSALERSKVCFNLIDAELRHDSAKSGVRRALLRWQPCRRTIDAERLRTLVALKNQACRRDPKAGRFYCDVLGWYIYWEDLSDAALMRVDTDKDDRLVLATTSGQMTQGLAELRTRRSKKLAELVKRLRRLKPQRYNAGGDLTVPLRKRDLGRVCSLLVGYYHLARSLGLDDVYRWHRRPR